MDSGFSTTFKLLTQKVVGIKKKMNNHHGWGVLLIMGIAFLGFGIWALSTRATVIGNQAAESGFAQAALVLMVGLVIGAILYAIFGRSPNK